MSLSPLYHVLTNDLHVSTARPTSIAVSSDFVVTRHRSPPFGSYRTLLPLDGVSGGHPSCRWSLRTRGGTRKGLAPSCPHNNNNQTLCDGRGRESTRLPRTPPRPVRFHHALLWTLCPRHRPSTRKHSRLLGPCFKTGGTVSPFGFHRGFFPVVFRTVFASVGRTRLPILCSLLEERAYPNNPKRCPFVSLLSSGEREPAAEAASRSPDSGHRRRCQAFWFRRKAEPVKEVDRCGWSPHARCRPRRLRSRRAVVLFNMPTPYFSAPPCPPSRGREAQRVLWDTQQSGMHFGRSDSQPGPSERQHKSSEAQPLSFFRSQS